MLVLQKICEFRIGIRACNLRFSHHRRGERLGNSLPLLLTPEMLKNEAVRDLKITVANVMGQLAQRTQCYPGPRWNRQIESCSQCRLGKEMRQHFALGRP